MGHVFINLGSIVKEVHSWTHCINSHSKYAFQTPENLISDPQVFGNTLLGTAVLLWGFLGWFFKSLWVEIELNTLQSWVHLWSIDFSASKTKVLTISCDVSHHPYLRLANHLLFEVDSHNILVLFSIVPYLDIRMQYHCITKLSQDWTFFKNLRLSKCPCQGTHF